MKRSFEKFRCPSCLSKLKLINKKLHCNSCKLDFHIINEIPRFVDSKNYTSSFGFQWNKFKKTQLDSYTKKDISRNRLYETTNFTKKSDFSNINILEAGSGAGRFTEIIAETKANVYTFDFSSAVDANYENKNRFDNINFFQADILNIPFEDNYFDIVICLGVIQHTQFPFDTFCSLAKKIKPGGRLYIDVYSKRWHTYLWSKYILRPLTTRLSKELLFKLIIKLTPKLIPITKFLKLIIGKPGMRISPIVEYSDLGLSKELNRDWSILDTFDMYSPKYDLPQSIDEVKKWFNNNNFTEICVTYGPNGIIGSGVKK